MKIDLADAREYLEEWGCLANQNVRALLEQAEASASACDCETCRPLSVGNIRMILCSICGNKRCPHATNHQNACTNSNEPGQMGSSYGRTR